MILLYEEALNKEGDGILRMNYIHILRQLFHLYQIVMKPLIDRTKPIVPKTAVMTRIL